jgi:hypothetical protein
LDHSMGAGQHGRGIAVLEFVTADKGNESA